MVPCLAIFRNSQNVVRPSMITQAKSTFSDLNIKVQTSGRFLGGVVGDQAGRDEYITNRVDEWQSHLKKLSTISVEQPQAAYAVLVKSFQHEWSFLQRVTPQCSLLFSPIEHTLSTDFLPSLLGHTITSDDRLLFSLPIRMGGLNIINPDVVFLSSQKAAVTLVEAITMSYSFSISDHISAVSLVKSASYGQKQELNNALLSDLISRSTPFIRRHLLRNQKSLSHWLSTVPIRRDNFDLSAFEFRDALCLRYSKPLLEIPSNCDGLNSQFTTSHALDCRKGGLVTRRHNEPSS